MATCPARAIEGLQVSCHSGGLHSGSAGLQRSGARETGYLAPESWRVHLGTFLATTGQREGLILIEAEQRRRWQSRKEAAVVTIGAAARGLVAGLTGVAAMTAAEKLEQAFTHRPNSYVPAHTLERLLHLSHKPDTERLWLNWAMHWGQGILLGAVRGLMAEQGVRGPAGAFLFTSLRLLNDQTLENATGVGSLPWTWPVDEQVIDLAHKAVYAVATGAVADRLVAGPPGVPRPRRPWALRSGGPV